MAQKVERSALVMHSAERMFELVNDVSSYPQFLPWCAGAEVHRAEPSQLVASLDIEKGAVRQRFTTCNRFTSPEKISIELVDGPFTMLSGGWTFSQLGDNASKVSLSLQFEFNGLLSRLAFGAVFSQAANSLVDAFCARANELYGSSVPI